MLKNALTIWMMVFAGACSAADGAQHGDNVVDAGGNGGAGGTGGTSDTGGAGGGTAGSGGTGGDDHSETLSDGVSVVAHVQEDIVDLLCQNNNVYVVQKQSRSVVRVDQSNGALTDVLTVGGDGDISIGEAGDNILVSVLGMRGRVSINSVTDGSEIEARNVPGLKYAAFGNERMYWAQGSAVYNTDGQVAASPVAVADLAIDQEGPVWLGTDGRMYRMSSGAVRTFGPVIEGAYAGTLVLFGATAVLGTDNGVKMLLFTGGQPMSWGSNATAVSKTSSAVTYCDSSTNVASMYILAPAEMPVQVTTHATCTHVAACGEYMYWTTGKNNVLRAALPSL